jgi:hypothetical protein
MRNNVMSARALDRGGRQALRCALGVLAVAAVLGTQAAPASAVERHPAAATTAADGAAGKAMTKAAGKATKLAGGKAVQTAISTATAKAPGRAAERATGKATGAAGDKAGVKAAGAAGKAGSKATGTATAKASSHGKAKTERSATHGARGAAARVTAAHTAGVQGRSAPSTLYATVDGDAATVTLTWTLPDENTAEVGFRLNGPTTIACPGTATAGDSCQLSDVPPGQYAVEYQEDSDGWVDADVSADVPVAPPADVTVTPSVHGLTVAWEPSASPGVTGYVATATPVDGGDGEPAHCASMSGCALADLSYQAYTVGVVATVDSAESEPATVDATPLPETPASPAGVTATLSGPNAITISWHAVTSAYGVPIKYMGGIGAENWGEGCWDQPMDALTCTVDGLPAGTSYTITAFAIGDVMSEPGHAAAKLTISLPSSVPTGAPRMKSDLRGADPVRGGKFTITGNGFQPFSTAVLAIYSTPVVLGSAIVKADGTFSATVTLPDGYIGSHTVLASGVDVNGAPRYMTLAVSIAEAGGGAGGLPVTGSPVVLLLILGAGLVIGGGGILVATRPRRPVAAQG